MSNQRTPVTCAICGLVAQREQCVSLGYGSFAHMFCADDCDDVHAAQVAAKAAYLRNEPAAALYARKPCLGGK